MPFDKNVFINCPFDKEFKKLLEPMLFSLIYFKFEPKISQTVSSANVRINQIKQHIRNSKYSIHDLSRSKPLKKNELPRFNMPYELGLDIGCATFGLKKYANKKILVLETERYYYQKIISDLAGQDIENHQDDPETLIRKLRNWFSTVDNSKVYPSANKVWVAFNQFYEDITKNLTLDGFTATEIENMPISDFIKFSKTWITSFTS